MTDRTLGTLLPQLQLSLGVGKVPFIGLLTLPEAFAGPSAGPRPVRAIRELIKGLPTGGALVVAGHKRTLRHVKTWTDLAQRPVTFVEIPPDVEFTLWSQDAFLACKGKDGQPIMLFPGRDLRAADAQVAEIVAAATGIRMVRTDLSFEGGNVLVGDSIVFVGADRISAPGGKAVQELIGALAGQRRMAVLRTAETMPGREIRLVETADGTIVEERFGYAGIQQPLFHIDAFVSLAGQGPDQRERVLVGDLRLATQLIGEEQLPKDQQCAADRLDEIAEYLARDDRVQIMRNPLPILPILHQGLRAWPRNKVASTFSGVAGFEEVLSELDRRGLKTVPVRCWRAATQNSCIVFRNVDGKDSVILPTFAHGQNRYLAPAEESNRRLWQSLGFDVTELPDFAPFAERNGSLHCMFKLIASGVPGHDHAG